MVTAIRAAAYPAPGISPYCRYRMSRRRSSWFYLMDGIPRSLQVFGQDITNFGMARDSEPAVLCWVVPPGMIAALSKKLAAVTAQVTQQLAALHRAMRSSTNCSPAAASASWRLNSIASARTSLRLAKRSALVRSWQLTPGTSSIQPIHQSPSCFSTAVYSAFTDKVYDGGCPFSVASMPNSGLYSLPVSGTNLAARPTYRAVHPPSTGTMAPFM